MYICLFNLNVVIVWLNRRHCCPFPWHHFLTICKLQTHLFWIWYIKTNIFYGQIVIHVKWSPLTLRTLGILGDLAHDGGVGDDDDKKWDKIHKHDTHQVVGYLLGWRREELKGDALGVVGVIRVTHHPKNETL